MDINNKTSLLNGKPNASSFGQIPLPLLVSAVHTVYDLFVTQVNRLYTSQMNAAFVEGGHEISFINEYWRLPNFTGGKTGVVCNEITKSAPQRSDIKTSLATEVLSIDLLLSCKGAIATCPQKRGKRVRRLAFFMPAEDETLLEPKSKVSHFVLGVVYCKPVVRLTSTIVTSVSVAPCPSLTSAKKRCSTRREKKCDLSTSPPPHCTLPVQPDTSLLLLRLSAYPGLKGDDAGTLQTTRHDDMEAEKPFEDTAEARRDVIEGKW